MSTPVEFNFHMSQPVIISAIKAPGEVSALLLRMNNKQAEVTYWLNSEREVGWFYEHELEAVS